jgi:hypothetical protein
VVEGWSLYNTGIGPGGRGEEGAGKKRDEDQQRNGREKGSEKRGKERETKRSSHPKWRWWI